jgi:hypothetical protein
VGSVTVLVNCFGAHGVPKLLLSAGEPAGERHLSATAESHLGALPPSGAFPNYFVCFSAVIIVFFRLLFVLYFILLIALLFFSF